MREWQSESELNAAREERRWEQGFVLEEKDLRLCKICREARIHPAHKFFFRQCTCEACYEIQQKLSSRRRFYL